jgi:hypothetical protein
MAIVKSRKIEKTNILSEVAELKQTKRSSAADLRQSLEATPVRYGTPNQIPPPRFLVARALLPRSQVPVAGIPSSSPEHATPSPTTHRLPRRSPTWYTYSRTRHPPSSPRLLFFCPFSIAAPLIRAHQATALATVVGGSVRRVRGAVSW